MIGFIFAWAGVFAVGFGAGPLLRRGYRARYWFGRFVWLWQFGRRRRAYETAKKWEAVEAERLRIERAHVEMHLARVAYATAVNATPLHRAAHREGGLILQGKEEIEAWVREKKKRPAPTGAPSAGSRTRY